jgi:hypothetical protein
MALTVSANSFIDVDYFNLMAGEVLVPVSSSGQSEDEMRLITLINMTVGFMENFCNRLLKARDFSYDSNDEAYNSAFAIFDAPEKDTFWFPTVPVNELTEFIVSDETITAATDNLGEDGYILYPTKGLLYYSYGFNSGYKQNIKIKWNGGIDDITSIDDYNQLQYIQYLLTKQMWDGDPINDGIISETLANYTYEKSNPKDLAEFMGVPIFVFNLLGTYKRYYFS